MNYKIKIHNALTGELLTFDETTFDNALIWDSRHIEPWYSVPTKIFLCDNNGTVARWSFDKFDWEWIERKPVPQDRRAPFYPHDIEVQVSLTAGEINALLVKAMTGEAVQYAYKKSLEVACRKLRDGLQGMKL